ncbi:MAG: hypothetical protein ABFS02_14240, partial [Pseudomonadota bacterium]
MDVIKRTLWLEQLQKAWNRRTIVWLSGVRRVGKTTLARMPPDAVYMNCDLPSTIRRSVSGLKRTITALHGFLARRATVKQSSL